MATKRFSIFGGVPDSSDARFTPYNVVATNDVWNHDVLVLDDTSTRIGVKGRCDIPQDYVGTASIIVHWSTTATTGDVEFDFDYRAIGGDDTESLDQAGTQESVNQNDTAPSAAHERMTATLALTSANLAAGDTLEFSFWRDGADAGDTIAAAVHVHDVLFQYADA